MNFSKFFPRLQKFLTKNPYYTSEKRKITIDFYIEIRLIKQTSNTLYTLAIQSIV